MKENQSKHMTRQECFALLEDYGTPSHVVRHCVAVTDTALKIATALNLRAGYHLNLELLQAAGLLHDIARVEENHGEVAASYLSSLGYEEEAALVRVHMFYIGDPDQSKLSEVDILCLSDRMVKENKYVGLEKRMSFILDKFKDDKEAQQRIKGRMDQAKRLVERIEKDIGMPIYELMNM